MSYYQGDFYGSGGYYRGDPFWGFLGRIAKGAVGLGKGLLGIGGGGGAVVKNAPMPGGVQMVQAVAARTKTAIMTAGAAAGRTIVKHPVLSAAGAAGALGAVAGRVSRGKVMQLPDGTLVHAHRRRRMNACNQRALKRAIRRAHAFEKLAKHVIGFSSPRKPKGHMYFKRRRKK